MAAFDGKSSERASTLLILSCPRQPCMINVLTAHLRLLFIFIACIYCNVFIFPSDPNEHSSNHYCRYCVVDGHMMLISESAGGHFPFGQPSFSSPASNLRSLSSSHQHGW